MRGEDRKISVILENTLDVFLNMSAFLAAYVLLVPIMGDTTVELYSIKTQFMLFLATVVSSVIYRLFDVYRPIPYINPMYSVARVVVANMTYFGLSVVTTLIFAGTGKRLFLFLWTLFSFIISTAVMVFKKRIFVFVVKITRKKRDIIEKVIIVGNNPDTARSFVREVIRDKHNGIMVLGAVGYDSSEDIGCEHLGKIEDLPRIISEYRPDDVVFSVDYFNKHKLIELVNLCDDNCVKAYFLPAMFGFFKSPSQVTGVGRIPLISVHSTPLDNRFNAFVKRCVDVLGSLVLIVLTSPIMLVAAIGVKLSSPGPIIFRQVRVGKMGKKFKMLKFRSMKVNSDSKTAWSTDIDQRKTRFGSFIRKTGIDELPQLINVLRGDMSLVGPRPEIPHFVEHFRTVIPLYMVKHYVKPGLTGLAQVKGLRGDTSVEDRIHEDIAYIENWTFGLDLAILLKTPFKAFNKSEKFFKPEEIAEVDAYMEKLGEKDGHRPEEGT